MNQQAIATLNDLLRAAAERFADRVAVTSREGLRTRNLSYGQLWAASAAVATGLLEDHALLAGDRVILIAPSGVRTVAVLFGLFRAGLIAVPLDLNSTSAFLDAVQEKTGARMIVTPLSLPPREGVIVVNPVELMREKRAARSVAEPLPDDIAEIVFTSGTTGTPKGVVLSHRNIVSDTLAAARIVPEGEAMNLVSVLPLSHMFEQTVGLFLPILYGGTVHYVASLRPSAIIMAMRRYNVTGMVVVPRFLELLMSGAQDQMAERGLGSLWRLQHRIAGRMPFSLRRWVFLPFHRALGWKLHFFLSGGAALPAATMRAWERTGVRIIEGYGATECAPVIASNSFDDRGPGSVGYPLAGVSARISKEGELQVSGPNVFGGYWNDPVRTAAALTEDGWYRTDDVAETAADGRFRIVGRLSDRIVLPNGMNVFPIDVEGALIGRPGIVESVVLSMPDGQGREHLHALIRPVEESEDEVIAQSVADANATLASHQRITGFTVWPEEFPKTPLLKVKRGELRKALAEKTGSQPAPEAAADPVGQIGRLLRQISPQPPETITEQTSIETDLGLDSLARVELGTLIERDMGRDVPEEVIAGVETVGDLVAELAKPRAKATAAPIPVWPRAGLAKMIRSVLQPALLFLPHRTFAHPFSVEGRDAFTAIEGPCLIIANHASHFDTLSIIRALPARRRQRTAVAAAADYFFANRLTSVLAALVLGAFPFSRGGHIRESLEHCGRVVDEGWSVLIYPEGTRSPDGRLLPFKAGIGLLATGLSVPVVPVSVVGGARVLPKGASWPHRGAVTLRFGPPLTIPPGMAPAEATRLLQQAVTGLLPDDMLPQNKGDPDGR